MKLITIKFSLFLILYINYSCAQNYSSKLNDLKKLEPVEVNKDYVDITTNNIYLSFNNYGRIGYTLGGSGLGVEYKNKILKPGGTIPAERMVHDFLGRKWNDEAFLSQKNLSK